ncbi:MAG: TetR/AcrR family transcriptional regulator, partial [Clostridiales bacterium]|nr:TetR/AcrR family transcriptional regulator [Clostridiales bacterium]
VGCAGEEELLRRYYNKEIGLDIEDIIKSVLLTRLFLLDIIDKKEVYEIVDNAIDIANNLNIDELLESFDIFLNKV